MSARQEKVREALDVLLKRNALTGPLHDAARVEVEEWETRQERLIVAAEKLTALVEAENARAEAAEAEADRLKAALEMLWTYYLLPISDEQKAQVVAALAPADRNTT